jgi:hypothetical protein
LAAATAATSVGKFTRVSSTRSLRRRGVLSACIAMRLRSRRVVSLCRLRPSNVGSEHGDLTAETTVESRFATTIDEGDL